jgi:hypothetical protein
MISNTYQSDTIQPRNVIFIFKVFFSGIKLKENFQFQNLHMMEEHMLQIIHKLILKLRCIINLVKKEIYVQIFVKYRKLMVLENFLESLNDNVNTNDFFTKDQIV